MYAKSTLESALRKMEGEKLLASLARDKNTRADRADIIAKLHTMFPDGVMLASLYVNTRATPEESLATGDFMKKFPDGASHTISWII